MRSPTILLFLLTIFTVGSATAAQVAAPVSLSVPVADADGAYAISWGASPTADVTYSLQEATNPVFTANLRTIYSGTARIKVIASRLANKTYYYRVKATRAGDTDSPWRTAAAGCAVPGTTAVAVPASLTVPLADSDGTYAVTWGDSPTSSVNYLLEEATSPTFTAGRRTVFYGAALSRAITGRLQNKTYYYRVKAIKAGSRDSSWRVAVKGCAVPGTATVVAPASLGVPASDADGAYTVSWPASTTAGASYVLQEATDSAFTQGLRTAYSGAASSKVITGRLQGKSYHYRVKAVKPGYRDSVWRAGAACTVTEIAVKQKLLLATAPDPAGIKVRNNDVFWSDSSTTPLKKMSVYGGEPTPLVQRYGVPLNLTVSGPFIYWYDGSVRRTGLDGSSTDTLAVLPGSSDSTDLVVDDHHVYIYRLISTPEYSHYYQILRIPVSGGDPTALAASPFFAIAALAGDAGNIYWQVDRFPDPGGSSTIRKLSKSGGSSEIVASGLRAFKGGLVLHGGSLYFSDTNYFDTYRIMKVSTSGGAVETLATIQPSGNDYVRGLAVDDSRVYWICASGVWAVPLSGGTPSLLAAAIDIPVDIALTADRVVWTETTGPAHGETGRVRSVAKSGGDAALLVTGQDAPRQLAIAADSLYWTEGGAIGAIEGFARIATAPVSGGSAATVVTGILNASPPFAVGDANVYVADGWRIKSIPLGGGNPVTLAVGDEGVVAVDTDGINVYWVDQNVNVFKVPTGGGEISRLNNTFTSGPAGPLRVLNGYVYWMDHYDAIKRVSVTGQDEITVVSGLPLLIDFTVDASSVYFSEWDTGWIRKVPNTGGSVMSLALAQAGPPIQLAVDGSHLYWLDSFKVGKVPVSGGPVTIPWWGDASAGSSLTVDLTDLYWAEPWTGEVVRLTPK